MRPSDIRFLAPTARFGSSVLFIASVAAIMGSISLQAKTATSVAVDSQQPSERMMIGLDAICAGEIPGVPMSLCFAPGTSADEVNQVTQQLTRQWAKDLAARPIVGEGDGGAAYYVGNRWLLGGSSAQGQPLSLTWSMPADGLAIPDGLSGGAASPNNLNATFVTKFGTLEAGKNLVRQVFARWSAVSGVSYTEVSDDGAAFGLPGGPTRGDIRIVGRPFSSNGVLAYNYFPNDGDMVIVTSNSNAWSAANNNRYFRNVIAHEHGHGLGIEHVCPTNNTKLMEPFISTAFDGPQNDDFRAAQRQYGDNYEPNDTIASAASGVNASGTTLIKDLSIDDNSDTDYFKFSATAGTTLTVTVTPQGPSTYLSGPQNQNGSCSAGTAVLPLAVHNLGVRIYNGTNTNPIFTQDAVAAGGSESISGLLLPTTGVYEIRVSTSSSTDDIQLYSMVTNIVPAVAIVGDVDGNGIVNGADLGILLAVWGPITCGSVYDLTGDCMVDGFDLATLLSNWG